MARVRPNLAFERTSTSDAPQAGFRYSPSRGAPLVPAAQLVRLTTQET